MSSRYLTNEIIKNIDFKNSKNIIELGPGLGTFTKVILKKANPDAKIICFEVNNKFCNYIKKNCADDRLIVINAGADSIRKELKKISIKKVDCIISGLPLKNFPERKRKKIIAEVKNTLNENGRFIIFQYTNSLSAVLDLYFDKVKKSFVPLNIPPSFVYRCEN